MAEIATHLPSFLTAQNPIDLATLPQSDPALMRRLLQRVAEDSTVDILLCVLGAIRSGSDTLTAELAEFARQAAKPMVMAWLASAPSGLVALSAASIPTFSDPSRATRAARRLLDAAQTHGALASLPAKPLDAGPVERLVRSLRDAGGSTLGEAALLPALGALGLRVPRLARARNAAEAAATFAAMGVPKVAVKIDSADIAHKTEVGGVTLGIDTPEACHAAAQEILDSVRAKRPEARIEGLLLAEMASSQAEVMIGISRDPVLGPFVAVGLGGVFVEVLGDIAFRTAPFGEAEAMAVLRTLKAWPLLIGTRSLPRLDVAALARTVATVSQLAAALPEIAELDLNPVLIGRDGEGVVVVDALLRLTPAA